MGYVAVGLFALGAVPVETRALGPPDGHVAHPVATGKPIVLLTVDEGSQPSLKANGWTCCARCVRVTAQ